jgi:hypothetical protein
LPKFPKKQRQNNLTPFEKSLKIAILSLLPRC